jgi:high mobility group protein B3
VRKAKAEKDPNKPKRPPSAFFVFMSVLDSCGFGVLRVRCEFVLIDFVCFVLCREGFRKEYKEQHPNVKQVSVVRIDSIRFDSIFALRSL